MSGPPNNCDSPLSLAEVLTEEHNRLCDKQDQIEYQKTADSEEQRLQDFYANLHKKESQRAALCLSGGGIRSATFSLGVIQALANFNLLDKFDYLSTVSGGGYIGSWLTAWIHRSTKCNRGGLQGVQDALKTDGARTQRHKDIGEPAPLTWLREYSNYLTPTLGLFSADSWTMIGTLLRNLLLNWLVLLPLLISVGMLPRLHTAATIHGISWIPPGGLLSVGLVLATVSLIYLHYFRPSFVAFRAPQNHKSAALRDAEHPEPLATQGWFLILCLMPLVLSAYCLTIAWAWYSNDHTLRELTLWDGWHPAITFAATGTAAHLLGWVCAVAGTLFHRWRTTHALDLTQKVVRDFGWACVMVLISGAVGGFILWKILDATPPTDTSWLDVASCATQTTLPIQDFAEWYAAFAVPGFLGLFLLVATLFIGLTGRFTGDQEHEFWARTGGWVLNSAIVLGGLSAVIIFGPGWVGKLGAWTSTSLGGAAGILSLVGGFSAKTLLNESSKEDQTSRFADIMVKVATPIFVLLLIVGLAFTTSLLVRKWSTWMGVDIAQWTTVGMQMPEPDPWVMSVHSLVLHNAHPTQLFTCWALLLTISMGMSFCININKFSLHGFYRNRLTRAYLGASRELCDDDRRTPHPLTGFDRKDNLPMAELESPVTSYGPTPRQRPFHIINVALNLVRPGKLAWQQRKAQSFTISPLHCGSWQHIGYRRANDYGYNPSARQAITLGTAVAISGAAASPNMGYHSSPAVTFLMTLFNIRLGWWIGNPGEAGGTNKGFGMTWAPSYKRSHPMFSIRPLLAELFGLTDANTRYVYLSDGGHFENLGLYEMVLRRCHHIVVVDAGCDRASGFVDLGNAIRKIRIDLGIEIDISTELLTPKDGSRHTTWHHAIGTIHYSNVDAGAPAGTLLYLKPSLSGDEPADVRDYAAQHAAFPHEPTSDQFFDESQFESYRRLGEHIGTEVFGLGKAASMKSLDDVFKEINRHSRPPACTCTSMHGASASG